MALPASKRLATSVDYSTIFRLGTSTSDRFLRITMLNKHNQDDVGNMRFGVSITKRVGKAVTRNLVKRRLYGLLQLLSFRAQTADVIITAWPQTKNASFEQLQNSLNHLTKRLRILEDSSAQI